MSPTFNLPVLFSWLILAWLQAGCSPWLWAQESRWPVQSEVGPFRFHCETAIDELATYSQSLSKLPEDLQGKLGVTPRVELIHVVVMPSDAVYQRYMQHYFPRVPLRRALFIQDRGPGIVFAYQHDELLTDLKHECTHALLQEVLTDLPLWLDEGLAEYFEAYDGRVSQHAAHRSHVAREAALGNVASLEELENCLLPEQMNADRYAQSWGWVEFLLDGPEPARQLLQGYLRDLAKDRGAAGKLSWRIRQHLPDWRYRFLQHARQDREPKLSLASDPTEKTNSIR